MADDAQARREARSQWTVQRFGPGEERAMAEADARFWLELSAGQRMALAWELSLESFGLAYGDAARRRLPRSAYRPVRR